jgi:hypothetical protein
MIEPLSLLMKNYLIISTLVKSNPSGILGKNLKSTSSPDAYMFYMQGQVAFYKNDFPTSIDWFLQALKIDSTLFGSL